MKQIVLCLAAVILSICPVFGQARTTAFINARIIPISGPAIEKGVLVIQNGKITAVGDPAAISYPADSQVIDMAGRVIMPGLIDSHSHIGSPAGGDASGPIQPDVRILDSVNVGAKSIQRAQAGGITTVNVMPGSGHLDSGQTLYLKLRDDAVKIDDLLGGSFADAGI